MFKGKALPVAIAMIQPEPLPGTYRHRDRGIQQIIDTTLREAEMVAENGFDGFILQNMNDGPIRQTSSPEAIAYMTVLGYEIVKHFPEHVLGILVNWDGVASVAVADAVGADFARVEHLYVGLEVSSCGLVEGQCAQICETRKRLNSKVPVFADVLEVNRNYIASRPPEFVARECVKTAYADGLFMSGRSTEESIEIIKKTRALLGDEIPIFLGGGATGDNIAELLRYYDGVSVATWVKNGDMKNPIDPARAEHFMREVARSRA